MYRLLKEPSMRTPIPSPHPEVRAILGNSLHPTRLARSSLIHAPGDPNDTVHLIERGRVRLYRPVQEGNDAEATRDGSREVSLCVLGGGDVFGSEALLGEQGFHDSFAEALEDTLVLSIAAPTLLAYMRNHPQLTVWLNHQLSRQRHSLDRRRRDLVFLEVSQRLAQALLQLARDDGEPNDSGMRIRGKMSHQDLAHLVGSTRETVTKILGEFRNAGLLELGYRRIVVTDVAGLEHVAVLA
jgi:CRP/FNR family transcriptional regulator, cyclic AMP receptor protein